MFQILTSKNGPFEVAKYTTFICPFCNTHMVFYSIPPLECVFCKEPLGDLLNILDTLKGTTGYHKTGKLNYVFKRQ